jgi:hypothetical protein
MSAVVCFKPPEDKATHCSIFISGRVDGVSVRFTKINDKFYISVRDLIIGICVKNPKKDEKSWQAAYKYASNTWLRIIAKPQKYELAQYLKTFQFRGN